MNELFSQLTRAMDGAPSIALSAALLWGVLSILLSPCHLASIPLIVGFIDEQGHISTKRAFWISLLFATGILITIAVIGGLTAAAGRIMGDLGPYANYLIALIFFIVGLHLLGVIPMFGNGASPVKMKLRGAPAAFILGLLFGIALGPCTFAFMAPLLGIVFKAGADHPVYAGSLLLAYGTGTCLVIVLAGTFTGAVQQYLNWSEKSKGALILKKICGLLVLLGGLYLVYTTA